MSYFYENLELCYVVGVGVMGIVMCIIRIIELLHDDSEDKK